MSFKRFFSRSAIATLFCVSIWAQAPAQGTATAGQPNWKDRAEYDLVEAIGKEADGNKKVAMLDQWKEKYPGTEFKKLRAAMYLQTWQGLAKNDKIYSSAKDVLAEDPKDMFALSMISYLTPVLTNTAPEALEVGEKAAQGVLANLDATFAADKKPAEMKPEQWAAQRGIAEAQSHKTLGWIAMIRKNSAEAQTHFTTSLEKNGAQGDVSYWLGQTILGERALAKYPLGIWHVARAASYDGAGGLDPAGRQQVLAFLTKVYNGYHGDDKAGLEQLRAETKNSALPPAGYVIKSIKEIGEENLKHEEAEATKNPQLALWKRIKDALVGAEGQGYFDSSMKDAQIPALTGYLVEQRGKELVISISDKTTPEVTLQLDTPVTGKVEPGTQLVFTGVGKSFTKDPFMLMMAVEKKDIKGLPSAAPAKRKPARRK